MQKSWQEDLLENGISLTSWMVSSQASHILENLKPVKGIPLVEIDWYLEPLWLKFQFLMQIAY